MIVTMHEAKLHFSKYVEKARAGEKRNNVILGVMKGAFEVPDDFDKPLPEEMLNELHREINAISDC